MDDLVGSSTGTATSSSIRPWRSGPMASRRSCRHPRRRACVLRPSPPRVKFALTHKDCQDCIDAAGGGGLSRRFKGATRPHTRLRPARVLDLVSRARLGRVCRSRGPRPDCSTPERVRLVKRVARTEVARCADWHWHREPSTCSVDSGRRSACAHSRPSTGPSRTSGSNALWPVFSSLSVNVPRGRISRMYLQDAVCELAFLAAWARIARQPS